MNHERRINYTSDFAFNILASLLVAGILQLAVYPYMASRTTASAYGVILTIMALVNMISSLFGGSLNNTRLIKHSDYQENKVVGDFNILLFMSCVYGFVLIWVFTFIVGELNSTAKLFIILTALTGIVQAYYSVYFRLKLDFKRRLNCNVIIAVGYLSGMVLFAGSAYWPLIFLLGNTTGCVYILYISDLAKEPLRKTVLFNSTVKKYFALLLIFAVTNVLVYIDRLLLFPLLGSEAVASFTVASFFGKTLGLIVIPISSVLLGYYAQPDFRMTRKLYWKSNIIMYGIAILFFLVTLVISPIITEILYPTLINSARPYLVLANLAAIISMTANLIMPSILKYACTQTQVVLSIAYGLLYIVLGIILTKSYGIMGFCVAAILSNSVQLALLSIVGHRSIKP